MSETVARTYLLPTKVAKQIDEVVKFINKRNVREPKTSRNDVVIQAINMFYDYMIKFEDEVKS